MNYMRYAKAIAAGVVVAVCMILVAWLGLHGGNAASITGIAGLAGVALPALLAALSVAATKNED